MWSGSRESIGTSQLKHNRVKIYQKRQKSKTKIIKATPGFAPKVTEPTEEVQLDFIEPISFSEHKQNYYITVSLDRLTRYPQAQVFKYCEHKQL